jgi:hypothetical protein
MPAIVMNLRTFTLNASGARPSFGSAQRFRKVVGVVIPIYLAATGLGRFRKEEPFPFGLRYRPAVVSCTMI